MENAPLVIEYYLDGDDARVQGFMNLMFSLDPSRRFE